MPDVSKGNIAGVNEREPLNGPGRNPRVPPKERPERATAGHGRGAGGQPGRTGGRSRPAFLRGSAAADGAPRWRFLPLRPEHQEKGGRPSRPPSRPARKPRRCRVSELLVHIRAERADQLGVAAELPVRDGVAQLGRIPALQVADALASEHADRAVRSLADEHAGQEGLRVGAADVSDAIDFDAPAAVRAEVNGLPAGRDEIGVFRRAERQPSGRIELLDERDCCIADRTGGGFSDYACR